MNQLNLEQLKNAACGEVGATGMGDNTSYAGTYPLGDSRTVDMACGPAGGGWWECTKATFYYMLDSTPY